MNCPVSSSGDLFYLFLNTHLSADLKASRHSYNLSIPLFLLAVGGSALAIFNYQKSSSSVVSSSLYALRVHDEARRVLGEEIQFKYKFPWISGKLNQFGGVIDISYEVKGTKGEGTMYFRSTRKGRLDLVSTEDQRIYTTFAKTSA